MKDSEREREFDAFVGARSAALLRTAYLVTGHRQTAEDLLQTALAKTYLAWNRIDSPESVEAYVRRVMVTTHVSWWRRHKGREQTTDPQLVALLGYASFPLFVLMLERRLFARGARLVESGTAILAAVGLVALVPDFSWTSDTVRGLALGVLSAFTFALLSVRNRKLVVRMTPTRIAFWQNLFAAACLAPIVALIERMSAWPAASDIGLLIVLGVACTGLAHTLFIASMQRVSAHTASVVAALEPVYGIALAVWLLGEVPSLRTVAGGTLIVAAALVASRRSV